MSTDKQIVLKRKARETTGNLLYSVIANTITPFEATKFFPKNIEDISLKIAWHALIHYDADEEMRIDNPEYAEEQIKYIEMIAKILVTGEELPADMLQDYEELYLETVLPKNYNWLGKLKAFFRFTN